MGRFEEIVKPQNKAIFTYRPMRVLPPHGMFAAPWDVCRPMGQLPPHGFYHHVRRAPLHGTRKWLLPVKVGAIVQKG